MKLTKEQAQEIKDQQSQSNNTKRVTVSELEKILYEAIPVLDHGFIRVVDYMGDDTVYSMLGDNLIGLTSKRELLIDSGTYEERSTSSSRLPGALINNFKMTL